MSAHTPGPWTLSADPRGRLVRLNRPGCVQEHLQIEPPVDAALIAAAPELLDLLREARSRMDSNIVHHAVWADRIDAAIAKAEGRHE